MTANTDLTSTGNAPARVEPKPEAKLMNSLVSTATAREITQNELSDEVYMSLISLQENLTIDVAATASTVTQVMAHHGKPTVLKLVCAILKLFNDGLNTSLRMDSRQLFEYAILWCGEFPHDTVKDLILCLKRVKAGRYGPIFNRIDGTVVSDFFRKYLAEKAEWGEQQNRLFVSEQVKKSNVLLESLTDKQKQQLRDLSKRPELREFLKEPLVASDKSYTDWLKAHAHDVEFEVLEDVRKRAPTDEIIDIVESEINRRFRLIEPPDQAA